MNNKVKLKKEITQLNEKVDSSFFPNHFQNEIYYSSIEYSSKDFISYTSNFSIKYVTQGNEYYVIDGKKRKPKKGQYLLINDGREVETIPIKHSKGISIFLDKKLITEVHETIQNTQEHLLDNGLSNSNLFALNFYENIFNSNDALGNTLSYLHHKIEKENIIHTQLQDEDYYLIAEKLIQSQNKCRFEINTIARVRQQTRVELYNKALLAKEYIHDNLVMKFDLDALSINVGLSKYHLIKVFKSVFLMTPYQYYLFHKVAIAKKHLKNNHLSIETVAFLCGFNDGASFSKIFKKIVGLSPSEYKKLG
ncbi:helix-turn-helix domain-containing protein [Tenacibaculum agarivorans]|uniref:helix-turn-helix domain-containing protein n=1 Tax=Tenacibaculum agarivorans TaxID=1908389 RepID=UPI00094BA959|nr:AraC family transcriptional regulator [Tenacibaculum agarivorans]